uniref:Uncharacterized protein n=1 Tax=Oryza sativa subsp. japonica TaxID=39947 RepID=Q6K302_ORYSJ|nr:hypothetical protein [Oryza sativa Japonica Group]
MAAAAAPASAANNGGGNWPGQDSCLTAAPGRGAHSKRLNGSSGSRGKKSPGPAGVKVGMEAGVYVAVHALRVGENVVAADGSPGSQDPLQRVWLEVHVWAADAGVQGGGHATSVVDDERRRP